MTHKPATALGLWLAYMAFVIYGSLVPLNYQPMPLEQAQALFARIPFLSLGLESRADWVANGVLYVPLGFLSARLAHAAMPRWPQLLSMPLALAWCMGLAVAVEFAQLFFPPRTVSQNDIMAEWIGAALGVALAPVFGGWMGRLRDAWFSGGTRLGWRLLEAYAVAYVALCFFPFDLLLSWAELQGKVQSGAWGWLLAPHERGPLFAALQLGVETGLAVPLGVLLARRPGAAPPGLAMAALLGGVLGLLIEGGQFFIASGVSQGASVLTRVAGVMLGVALAPALGRGGVPALQALLRRHAPWLVLAWLPVLLFVNGWFRQPWQGMAAAAGVWAELRLLPFYYHYYTTEAIALFSLGSVAIMYAPAAVLGWACGLRRSVTLMLVALLALGVEASKLFLKDMRPDPTNVLIATGAAALVLMLLGMVSARQPAGPGHASPQSAPQSAPSAERLPLGWLMLPFVAAGAALWAWLFPAFPLALLALLAACAAAVWMRPVLALALIPAALPVLDLAPWSGRFFWDEFDLLQAVCIAVAFCRTSPTGGDSGRLRMLTLAFGLLGLSLALSTLRALWPWQPMDASSFTSYYSPVNALRIVKGALWAWLFVALWRRMGAFGQARAHSFGAGMAAGLALTVLFVAWERASFVSLLDFSSDFRVSGPISAMHKGGAYLECWLAVASAFVMAAVIRSRSLAVRAAGLVLLAGASYAVMVTFSRNGYAALAVGLLVAAAAAARGGGSVAGAAAGGGAVPDRTGLRRRLALGAVGLLLAAAVAVPVLTGPFARERLARSAADLAVRQAHWADALRMRAPGWTTTVFGMGLGRFPESHFWLSGEPVRAAPYRLVQEGDNTLLRLGAGATLYIDQVLPRPADGALMLKADLRSSQAPARLAVTLCEKWGLTSQSCVAGTLTASGPAAAGGWQRAELRLNAAQLAGPAGVLSPPLKLSLLTPAGDARVDVDRLSLETSAGQQLLANGDFSAGLDHWFFATDIDPPWHIHSLPVAVLFDQGWLGALAWALVVAVALGTGVLLALRGQAQVPAALGAVVAFLVSGSLNTLIDAPRFLWLLLVLLWLAAAARPPRPAGQMSAEKAAA